MSQMSAPPIPPDVQDPVTPYPNYWADNPHGWVQTAEALRDGAHKARPHIVFIGDSITQAWGLPEGRAEWDAQFAPLGAFNAGIGGDKTNQILWRLEHGLLDGLSPRLVVLKIGVNNLWNDRHGAARISEGIGACVAATRAKVPGAKILVLGILPTQETPDHPLRVKVSEINAHTARLADNQTVFYRDLSAAFLSPDGILSKEVAPDLLHLSATGYARFGDALEPIIREMLR